MAVNGVNYVFLSLTLFALISVCLAAQNVTKVPGICHLEVPTIDIISESERATADSAELKGNGTKPGYSKITICCSGYKLAEHTHFHCVPNCPNGCENGNCTAPNVCTCNRGYIKGPDENCVSVCPKGCFNGVCTRNGDCSCNDGYTLEPNKQYCIYNCSKDCGPGGKCAGKNECSCKPGYKKGADGKCEFFCENDCGQGKCIGPNICSCNQDYELINDTCTATCPKGCLNGICSAPNKCTCNEKWTLDKTGTICEAQCTKPCLNGKCVGPDKCECNKGYILDPQEAAGYRCVAHCPEGCPNGICSGPNFCICNQGYVKQSRESHVCIKRVRRANLHLELIPNNMF